MVCPVPRSGRYGFAGDYTDPVLTKFARIRNWTLDPIANPEVRVYSGLRFGTQRIPGFVDYTGTFEGFGGNPPLFPGDSFNFIGYTAPTSGVPCTPGYAYILPAIVERLTITWNWTQENRGVNWSIGFVANGTITVNTAFDDPCDDAVYCDTNPCNLTFVMRDPCSADAIVEWCNLVSATLTFTSNLDTYSNNSTNCELRRVVGNLDWTLEVVDQNPFIVPILQKDYRFTILTSTVGPTSWDLKWGQMIGASNFRVDTESGEMIGKTNTFAMQAVNCCVPSNPERGEIINPDGEVVWPYPDPV